MTRIYARRSFVFCLFAFAAVAALPNSSAQDRDVVGTIASGRGIEEGSKLSVRCIEKAREKTAVGVSDIGKGTKKALE